MPRRASVCNGCGLAAGCASRILQAWTGWRKRGRLGPRQDALRGGSPGVVLSDTLYVAGLPPFANEEWVAILLGRSRVKADGDGAAGARQVYLYRDARGVPSGAALVGMVSVDAVPAPSLPY